MLFRLRTKAQLVNVINGFAQVVAAVNLVFDLAKNLADLVFNRVRTTRPLFEAVEIRDELLVDEVP